MASISFEQLSEVIPDEQKPPLDRTVIPSDFQVVDECQMVWRETGRLRIPRLISDEAVDAYCTRFIHDRGGHASPDRHAWRHDTPYMDIDEIKDICLDQNLMTIMEALVGYQMGLHLNLIEWTSTERDWHQDDYLNPDFINSHYAAVWFALDDIHPDSGPFQYVPGSHRWPMLRRQRVYDAAPPEMKAMPGWNTDWPSLTQGFVAEACEEEIRRRGAEVHEFLPATKGDVLIWHGGLIHRGSRPKVRGMERRALIAHYSSLTHRFDMPRRSFYINPARGAAGHFFVL